MSYQLTDLSAWGIEAHVLRPGTMARRLLVAYAHPDDESFGNAGTLARYAAEGVGVHYVCGTNGECGGVAPALLAGYRDIAELRIAELNSAAHTLGLAGYYLLNYRDSGMAGAPDNQHAHALAAADPDLVTAKMVAAIRAIQPHVVVTFNPYGGYGHPDHIMMHQATVAAFNAAADPAAYPEQLQQGLSTWQTNKLYYSTFPGRLLRLWSKVLPLFGVDPQRVGENNDMDFIQALAEATPVTTRIACSAYSDTIMEAWLCHRSQLGSMALVQKLPRAVRQMYMNADHFTQVLPQPTHSGIEDNLFAGIAPSAVV